ncbi:CPBP family intramembrane glutamic endopeptidase [Nocardia australiensis]|uniref:CPBP family intramembrane glutamic endopeptidase n=1 Tax=Nocardia australiensis TaxID=2887191 RepID=UPI001D14BA7D|nr:CPBP family intramembrane glutamic endopeptidase [Nocardia australiensis]
MSRVPRVIAAIGIPLMWSNVALPRLRLGMRGRTAVNAGFATGYAFAFAGRPNWLSKCGLRDGLLAGAIVTAGYAAALAIPAVRGRLGGIADRSPEVSPVEWITVHIPIGTVYSEELVFRATLDPLLDSTFSAGVGRPLGAAVFGLWHIRPARAADDNIAASIAVTTMAGLVFGWLRRRADSAAAPALLHLAVNAGGAIATLAPPVGPRHRAVQ